MPFSNLIVNGDFETGNTNGWINFQSQNSYVLKPGYNSSYSVFIGNYSSFSMLFKQQINTIVGKKYSLSYVLSNPANSNFMFDARINNEIVAGSSINSNLSFEWTNYVFTFTASSTVTDISFFSKIDFSHPYYCFIDNISVVDENVVCFKEGSKILTNKGYKLIQDLRKGDLVKTLKHDYKAIDMIGKSEIYHSALQERIHNQLYKCSKSKYPEIFEPLIITGHHSILVNDFVSDEQREKTSAELGKIYITDDKYRLPVCLDKRASVYETPGDYTIYHLALENDNYYMNYGIYANGLLVETCSKRYLKELSNMSLIE